MKGALVIIILFLSLVYVESCGLSKTELEDFIKNDTTKYYSRIVNDTTFYVGLNYYRYYVGAGKYSSTPLSVDSMEKDTIIVVRSCHDSITFYTEDAYYDIIEKAWFFEGSYGTHKINNKYSYKRDLSNKEAIYTVGFHFYGGDSLFYEHKKGWINLSITETYKFKGKRYEK